MPNKKSYARIAITLPPETLAAADRLAASLDRSRSWVIAEAVRQFAARPPVSVSRSSAVQEPQVAPYEYDPHAEARVRLLAAELELSPEERLRRAEELVQLARLAHPRPRRNQIIAFDNWDDFARWKAADRIRL